jgi:hypothetical protein
VLNFDDENVVASSGSDDDRPWASPLVNCDMECSLQQGFAGFGEPPQFSLGLGYGMLIALPF